MADQNLDVIIVESDENLKVFETDDAAAENLVFNEVADGDPYNLKVRLVENEADANLKVRFAEFLPWSPADIETAAWYDADDSDTVQESGGSVYQLDDKSGNDLHLGQLAGSAQPVSGSETVNGLNVLTFSTLSKSLNGATASDWNFLHGPNGTAMFVVNYIETPGDTSPKYYMRTRSATTGIYYYARLIDGEKHGAFMYENGVTTAAGVTGDFTPFGTTQLLSYEHGTSRTNDFGIYVDGVERLNIDYSSTPVGGYDADSPFAYGHNTIGKLAEIIMLDRLPTDSERQKIEGYLAWKWSGAL
jgi:hypothetical protein